MRGRERGEWKEDRGEKWKKVRVKRGEKKEKEEWQRDNAKRGNNVTAVSQSYISFASVAMLHIETTPDPEQTDSVGRKVKHTQVCTSADTRLPARPTLPLIRPSQYSSPNPH